MCGTAWHGRGRMRTYIFLRRTLFVETRYLEKFLGLAHLKEPEWESCFLCWGIRKIRRTCFSGISLLFRRKPILYIRHFFWTPVLSSEGKCLRLVGTGNIGSRTQTPKIAPLAGLFRLSKNDLKARTRSLSRMLFHVSLEGASVGDLVGTETLGGRGYNPFSRF